MSFFNNSVANKAAYGLVGNDIIEARCYFFRSHVDEETELE